MNSSTSKISVCKLQSVNPQMGLHPKFFNYTHHVSKTPLADNEPGKHPHKHTNAGNTYQREPNLNLGQSHYHQCHSTGLKNKSEERCIPLSLHNREAAVTAVMSFRQSEVTRWSKADGCEPYISSVASNKHTHSMCLYM